VHNSSGLVAYYIAGDLSNEVQITLVSGTLGTYVSGGFVAVDNANMPGWYEVGIPDAALDGGNQVAIQYRGATNMAPVNIYIDLDAVDYQTDAFGALKPTTAGRTLDVTATGAAGIDLANVENQGSTLNLSATSIKTATDVETDTQDIQTRLPTGLVDGRIAAIAQVVGDKTGYKLASDGLSLVTQWAVAITGNITGNLSGSVGSVTGNVGGNVVGSVGSISGVTFPANFSLLMITGSGAIGLVDELGPQALSANSLEADIANAVWNTLTTTTFTDQSFGDRILISTNNTRQVAVTGSNHVASVLHDAEPNSIPEDAFVTGSISARAIGTDAIDADALADGATTEIANAVAATQALSRLDSMIESDGAGQFRFDVIALENAPAGGGGGGTDWTANERSAIRSIFGFDSSGNISIPSLGVLDAIKDKTDLITTGTIQSSIPVTIQGQITGPLFIGDDYLSANGRAFQWTVALPSGFVIATSTCRFGMEHAEGATTGASFAVAGTVTDAGGGNVTLSFDVPKATTGTLKAGFYRWSVEIASAGGNEVTRVASDGKKLVEWREKQT